ncbi:MAG: hypothetical protein HZA89_15355 [Verrucomicrobia bacterium]|nr:hypothetical protein [Verrucomicrobiota bacterium]
MNPPSFNARRATLDDLPVLRPLWSAGQLDALHLEKRLTDFQVAETAEGRLVAAVGLHVDGLHGRVHSECYLDAAQTDALRALFWERLLAVARNRGLVRLWTLEAVPFWREHGFAEADAEIKKKFPAAFGDESAAWLTFKLKEELAAALSMDHEFELFRQASEQDRERMMRQGRIMKGVATVLALMLFIAVIVGGVLLFKKHRLRVPFSGSAPAKQR